MRSSTSSISSRLPDASTARYRSASRLHPRDSAVAKISAARRIRVCLRSSTASSGAPACGSAASSPRRRRGSRRPSQPDRSPPPPRENSSRRSDSHCASDTSPRPLPPPPERKLRSAKPQSSHAAARCQSKDRAALIIPTAPPLSRGRRPDRGNAQRPPLLSLGAGGHRLPKGSVKPTVEFRIKSSDHPSPLPTSPDIDRP